MCKHNEYEANRYLEDASLFLTRTVPPEFLQDRWKDTSSRHPINYTPERVSKGYTVFKWSLLFCTVSFIGFALAY